MSAEIRGISLSCLDEAAAEALRGYTEQSDGQLTFDTAPAIELTTEEPYSGRATIDMLHCGEYVGQLAVIALAPGEGNGGIHNYPLIAVDTGRYPAHPKVIPRFANNVHTGVHLTLAAYNLDVRSAEPQLYAGNLDLLSLRFTQMDMRLRKISELGQLTPTFHSVMAGYKTVGPAATLTVGSRLSPTPDTTTERFGDPHCVYNPHPAILQLCGFFTLSKTYVNENPDAAQTFCALRAQTPGLLP